MGAPRNSDLQTHRGDTYAEGERGEAGGELSSGDLDLAGDRGDPAGRTEKLLAVLSVFTVRFVLPSTALVRLMLDMRPMSVVDTGLVHVGAENERLTGCGSSSGKPTCNPRGDNAILTKPAEPAAFISASAIIC